MYLEKEEKISTNNCVINSFHLSATFKGLLELDKLTTQTRINALFYLMKKMCITIQTV